tara:strand:+ start:1228 stop:1920 length:693 start_codon:yes stop_codon:yes gene_type:complete
MPPSTSKYKLYLYLFFLIFLSSIFNFKFLENNQSKFRISKINIYGISNNEKKMLEIELNSLKKKNLFKLSESAIKEKLNKFNFIEEIYVNKVIPSSININLSKTSILAKTLKDGENFYVGKNGKFINSNEIQVKEKIATVFGDFKIVDFLYLQNILKNNQLEMGKIENYYYYKNKRWDILFSNGLLLRLPSKNIGKSIKIYKKLLKNKNSINTKIIDLRIANQIILTNNE